MTSTAGRGDGERASSLAGVPPEACLDALLERVGLRPGDACACLGSFVGATHGRVRVLAARGEPRRFEIGGDVVAPETVGARERATDLDLGTWNAPAERPVTTYFVEVRDDEAPARTLGAVRLEVRLDGAFVDGAVLDAWAAEHEPHLRGVLRRHARRLDLEFALAVAGTGPDERLFEALLEAACARLEPDAAVLVELLDPATGAGRALAVVQDGCLRDDLRGAELRVPHDETADERPWLDWSFDEVVVAWNGLDASLTVSVTALAVRDGRGRTLGYLVLLGRRPAPPEHLPLEVLSTLAGRIGVELSRARSEARRLSNERRLGQSLRLRSLALFAGGLSHELNNLMMAVRGNAELALSSPELTAPQRERVEEIRAASCSAAALTSQLLAFVGRTATDTHVTDLTLWLHRWVGLARSTAPPHVMLEVDLSTQPTLVALDSVGFFQALAEVLTNALEAVGDGNGRIRISSGNERVDPTEIDGVATDVTGLAERTYARVSVTNVGAGISREAQDRAFDPFYSTKEDARGMGLSVAAGIVRDLGGCMTLRNVDEGVRVDLWIPVVEEEPPAVAKAEPGGLPRRVLLVEDEAPVRLAVRLLLEHLGIEVLEAGGGAEALELLEREGDGVDLVVADFVMPRMDGLTFLQRALELAPGIARLLVSGFHDGSISPRMERMRPLEVLQKPFSIEDIDAALRRAIAQNEARQVAQRVSAGATD